VSNQQALSMATTAGTSSSVGGRRLKSCCAAGVIGDPPFIQYGVSWHIPSQRCISRILQEEQRLNNVAVAGSGCPSVPDSRLVDYTLAGFYADSPIMHIRVVFMNMALLIEHIQVSERLSFISNCIRQLLEAIAKQDE
jgi:hypothetical protein